jgi:phosphopantothenoylcysteine synthetase/decarboxylase
VSKNILLGVTGSIAAYKACEIISLLKKKGHTVKCVMSKDAKWFVTPLSLEVLSGHTVACDMFERPEKRTTEHVSLSDEADVILVAPATADILGKVASGICDDMLTCVICAAEVPVVFAPAMNDKMYKNPIVQDKIAYLKEKGYFFVEPVVGHLACDREGMGHLAPVETIVGEAEKVLNGRI